jgi:hypothetical protein
MAAVGGGEVGGRSDGRTLTCGAVGRGRGIPAGVSQIMARSRFPARTHARALIAAVLLALIAIAAVVVIVVGGGSQAPSRGRLESMFQDDAFVLYQPPAVVARTLDTLKSLGVDRVRVQVLWGALAPNPLSPAAPRGFEGANPASYATASWAPYDRVLTLARARGMGVDFDITAPGPLWAMRRPAPDPNTAFDYAPSVALWKQFVTAVGRRYSGSYTPPGTHAGALPRVNYWSIWNEPNQPGWLAPQLRTFAGARVPDAPRLYREYADAAFEALSSTGHGPSSDTILVGETAPEGCIARGPGCRYLADNQPIAPMLFVEALYCVDGSFHPLRGSLAVALHCPVKGGPNAFVAAHPALFQATGYAHHPYSLLLAPNIPFLKTDTGFVSLANLSTLERGLDRIFATYGVNRQIPIYLTEYGYETNPPNPFRGVSPAFQSRYLNQATYMAWRDPRVRTLAQFLLVDSLPNAKFPPGTSAYWSTFQTGLEYTTGVRKPSFNSYRLPVYMPQTTFHAGGSVLVWAMLRAAPDGSHQHALIQWRPKHGAYRTLADVSTDDPNGVISTEVQPPGSGAVRLQWTSPSGQVLDSRAVGVFSR